MNPFSVLPFFRRTISPKQVLSATWSDRASILESNVNLFCWQRDTKDQILNSLKRWAKKDLRNIRSSVELNFLEANLRHCRSIWDPDIDHAGDAFWSDVSQLTQDFLILSGANSGTLHLRKVENDACTKFHLDGYRLRLFTTYLGPGTEWLPEESVNRSALGTSNDRIVKKNGSIRRMRPFEVGVLKGEVPTTKNRTPGIVHRSPAIVGSDKSRIILRIDL